MIKRADAKCIGSFLCVVFYLTVVKSVLFRLISYIVEDVLLGYAGVGAEGGVIEIAAEVGVDSSLHPHVDGECFKVGESEQGGAGGYLIADTLDVFQSFEGVLIARFRFDICNIYLSCSHFFSRVKYVSVAETRL